MNLHFLLALFWLALGTGLLVALQINPELSGLRLGGDGMPIGWLALAFAVYNLVQWWARRRPRIQPQLRQAPEATRKSAAAEYRPEFDFSKPDHPESPPRSEP